MKSLATAAMLSMAVMAGAQAADVEPSRAQVQAELAQAKASVNTPSANKPIPPPSRKPPPCPRLKSVTNWPRRNTPAW